MSSTGRAGYTVQRIFIDQMVSAAAGMRRSRRGLLLAACLAAAALAALVAAPAPAGAAEVSGTEGALDAADAGWAAFQKLRAQRKADEKKQEQAEKAAEAERKRKVKEAAEKKAEAKAKADEAAEKKAKEQAKKAAEAARKKKDEEGAKQKKQLAAAKKQLERLTKENADLKERVTTHETAAKERTQADKKSEEAEKQRVIEQEKRETPKIDQKPEKKQCRAKGPATTVCAVAGGGNVTPFDGGKMHRLGAKPVALVTKFKTLDPKYRFWVAASQLTLPRSAGVSSGVRDVMVRCGADAVRVLMTREDGKPGLPRVQINKAAPFVLPDEKHVALPGAPAAKHFYVRRARMAEGKGEKSLYEVEISCGLGVAAKTQYATGTRVNVVHTGWQSEDRARDQRAQLRVIADARYMNMMAGECGWGAPEEYPAAALGAEPKGEATPELAGGPDAQKECDDGDGGAEDTEAATAVKVDGKPGPGAPASSDNMIACEKLVESCVGVPMSREEGWFARLDADVSRSIGNAVKGCAADRTAKQTVQRPQMCATVCGFVQDARTATVKEMADAMDLAKDCTKQAEARTLLQGLVRERTELSRMCGGKPTAADMTEPALPDCADGAASAAQKGASGDLEAAGNDDKAVVEAAEADAAEKDEAAEAQALQQQVRQKRTPNGIAGDDEGGDAAGLARAKRARELVAGLRPEDAKKDEFGLLPSNVMPCDDPRRATGEDRVVKPKAFEDNPLKPLQEKDWKTTCSKTTNT